MRLGSDWGSTGTSLGEPHQSGAPPAPLPRDGLRPSRDAKLSTAEGGRIPSVRATPLSRSSLYSRAFLDSRTAGSTGAGGSSIALDALEEEALKKLALEVDGDKEIGDKAARPAAKYDRNETACNTNL